MSRIEDNEAERMERQRQDIKQQAQKSDATQKEQAARFNQQMQQTQSAKQSTEKRDQQKGEQQHQSANQTLLSRRGIDANKAQSQFLKASDTRNDETRRKAQLQEQEGAKTKGQIQKQHAAHESGASSKLAVSRSKKDDSNPRSGHDKDKGQKAQTTKDEAGGLGLGFNLQGQPIAPLSGIETQGGSVGTGAPQALTAKQIIASIVAHVRQGIDQHGMGLIQIDLQDDVMAGARLTFWHTDSGISLKVETGDQDAQRILQSGSTAHELSVALKHKHINLLELEVNGEQVVRS